VSHIFPFMPTMFFHLQILLASWKKINVFQFIFSSLFICLHMYLRRSSREKISSNCLILCTPKKSQKIVNFKNIYIFQYLGEIVVSSSF
jgi:hypothetical protein